MKGKIIYVVMVLLLIAANSAFAEVNVFSVGKDAYVFEDEQLYVLDESFQITDEVIARFEGVEKLYWFADAWYTLSDSEDGKSIDVWINGEKRHLFSVDQGAVAKEFLICENAVVILWQEEDVSEHNHYPWYAGRVDVYDFAGQEILKDQIIATSVALSNEGILVAEMISEDVIRIIRMNVQEAHSDVLVENVLATAVCEVPSGVAYVDINGLQLWDKSTNQTYRIQSVSDFENAVLRYVNDCIVLGYTNTDRLEKIQIAQDKNEMVLTLVNCGQLVDARMEKAKELFQQSNPGVQIRFVEMTEQQLKTKLMAQDEGVDVLYVDNFLAADFVAAGLLMDLHQCDAIDEQLHFWVDISDAITLDGVLFGVPWSVQTDAMYLNDALVGYLPQSIDVSSLNWRDLMQAGVDFVGDTDGNGTQDIYLWCDSLRFPVWLFQYMASFDETEQVNFDTAEFRELLQLYKLCVQSGAFANMFDGISLDQVILNVETMGAPSTVEYVQLPQIESGDVVTSQVYAFGVNNGSNKKELACEFLAYYAMPEVQKLMQYGDEDTGFYYVGLLDDSTMYSLFDALSENERLHIETNKEYMSESVVSWRNAAFNKYFGDLVETYLNDEISLDEMIDSLQQRLLMQLLG